MLLDGTLGELLVRKGADAANDTNALRPRDDPPGTIIVPVMAVERESAINIYWVITVDFGENTLQMALDTGTRNT